MSNWNAMEADASARSRAEIEGRKRRSAEPHRALKAAHEADLKELNEIAPKTGPRPEGYQELTEAERQERAERITRWLDGEPARLL